MSSVMIRCPATGLDVSTAIETEPSVFRKLPRVAGRMHCPACGQDHVWTVGCAWLAGEPRLVDQAAPSDAVAA
ncbi:MAG TPA: hypothetical protein VEC94_09940 [Pseudolabrys sp.]|nr:hypothetical protein [Pseudolabrys sp.]